MRHLNSVVWGELPDAAWQEEALPGSFRFTSLPYGRSADGRDDNGKLMARRSD